MTNDISCWRKSNLEQNLQVIPETKGRLSNIAGIISKMIGVKFRNAPGNIKIWKFFQGLTDLYNLYRCVTKSKPFSPGSDFRDFVFNGEISGVDSAKALGKGV